MAVVRLSRRELLSAGAAVLAAAKFASAAPGFKIGACDWTLGKRSDPGSFEVAARIGLDGVQVDLVSGGKFALLQPEMQQAFLAASKKHGVEIGSLALGELNRVPYKSDPRAEEWVSQSVDVSRALGTKVVLLAFFSDGDLQNDPKGIDAVVERLRRVAPKAEKAGVTFGFESWLSADQLLDILQRVGSPALKVYYDVANAHKQGYDIYREIRRLGKQICEFHAKDYSDLYGKGSINFPEVRKAMDDIGYRGWIHMEGVQLPLGIEESCKYDLAYLKRIFP
jgi:L-ribulose-5-phosphate 3-epimerase